MTNLTEKQKKKIVLKAISKGAIEPHLKKYGITDWFIYKVLTKKERDMAKAQHEAIIRGIFES